MQTHTTLAQKLLHRGSLPDIIYRVDIGEPPGAGPAAAANHIASFLYSTRRPEFTYSVVPMPILVADRPAGLAQSVDPLTGGSTPGTVDVRLLDHAITRALVKDHRLLGKTCAVWLGFNDAAWAYTDWIPVHRGRINAIDWADALVLSSSPISRSMPPEVAPGAPQDAKVPQSTGAALGADTDCDADALASVANPLTLMTELLELAGVPSEFIDSTSFDPTDAANDELEHLRVHRVGNALSDRRITGQTRIWDIITELAFLCHGFIHFTEEGKATFQLLDTAASTVATWTDDDIVGLERTETTESDIITSVRVNCGIASKMAGLKSWSHNVGIGKGGNDGAESFIVQVTARETVREGAWGHTEDGAQPIVRKLEVDDRWFGALGYLLGSFSGASPGTIDFVPFCTDQYDIGTGTDVNLETANGFGWPGLGGVAAVSADRPLYLAVVDPETRAFGVFKYTALTAAGSPDLWAEYQATGGTFISGDNTIAGLDDGDLLVVEVSAAMMLALELLPIYVESSGRVQVRTKPHTLGVQIGDLVALSTDRYVTYGYDGDPSGEKFMVLEKNPDPESLEVEWVLRRVTSVALTYTGVDKLPPWMLGEKDGPLVPDHLALGTDYNDGYGFTPHMRDDVTGGAVVGLTQTIEAGIYVIEGAAQQIPEFDHTYGDNLDTWVGFGGSPRLCAASGRIKFVEVANGAPEPAKPTGCEWVMRVRTSGGAITEVLNLGNRNLVGTRAIHRKERYTLAGSESMGDCLVSGFDMSVPGGGGLVGTIPAGVVMNDGVRVERLQDEYHTFTASRYTYVDIDGDGVAHFVEQALAGATETLPVAGRVRVLVVTTDATDITAVARYPETRRQFARAVAPGAVRDGQTPNPLFADYDTDAAFPRCWAKTEGAGTTITATGENVTIGHWAVFADVGAGAASSYIKGDDFDGLFEVNPHQLYTGSVFYHTGSEARTPSCYFGLEFFDRRMVSLGVRNFIANGRPPALASSDGGGVEEGVFQGAGAGQTQIPPTAVWARWVLQFDDNGGGTSGIYISAVRLDAGGTGSGGGTSTHAYVVTIGTGMQYPTLTAAVADVGGVLPTPTASQRMLFLGYPGTTSEDPDMAIPDHCTVRGIGSREDWVLQFDSAGTDGLVTTGATGTIVVENCTLDADSNLTTNTLERDSGCTLYVNNVGLINGVTGFYNSNTTDKPIILKSIRCNENTTQDLRGCGSGPEIKVYGFDSRSPASTVTYCIRNDGCSMKLWNIDIYDAVRGVLNNNAASETSLYGGTMEDCTYPLPGGKSGSVLNAHDVLLRSASRGVYCSYDGGIVNCHDVIFDNITNNDIYFNNVTGEVHLWGCYTDPSTWSIGTSPGTIINHDWGQNQYIARVSEHDENAFTSPVDASDYLQGYSLSATQRATILIDPGSYTLAAACDLDEFIDIEGTGDSPAAVQITSATNVDAFQDMGAGTWSLRNLTVIADGTGYCVDANAGGGGVLEDVRLVGDSGGAMRTTTDVRFEGYCEIEGGDPPLDASGCTVDIQGTLKLVSDAGSTQLLDLGAAGLLVGKGGTLILQDDDTASGITTTATSSIDIDMLHATGTGGADGINLLCDASIRGGVITGFTDGIDVAISGTSIDVGLWSMYVTGGTWGINDSAAAGLNYATIDLHGCHIPNDKIDWTPGYLKVYGHRFDGDDYESKFLMGLTAGIVLTNGAWTTITFGTNTFESAWSTPGGGVLQFDRRGDIVLEYHLSCIAGASGGATTFYARIERSIGGGAWTELSDSRSYDTTQGSSEYASLSQRVVLQNQAYQNQYRVSVWCAGTANGAAVGDACNFTGSQKG